MGVLDLQRRSQQIGRIRIGQQVKAASGKLRPARLDTFRFTTGSRDAADAIATLYGGEVRPWENRGRTELEVITGVSEIGAAVPPRDAVVSQWYEMWSAGGCQRRCNSQIEQRTGKPCMCPHAEDPSDADEVARCALERAALAKLNPPQACHLITRISLLLPDIPGLGVFRLDTGSFYAAGEIIDQATLMEMARAAGVFLPVKLRIEQRVTIRDGQTKKYPVPVLDVLTTARAIMTGELAAGEPAAQLPPAPGAPLAITAGTPAPTPAAPPEAGAAPASGAPRSGPMTAQQIADAASLAKTRGQLRQLWDKARPAGENPGCLNDLVCTDREQDLWEELRHYLTAVGERLPAAGAPPDEPPPPPEPPADDGSLFGGEPA